MAKVKSSKKSRKIFTILLIAISTCLTDVELARDLAENFALDVACTNINAVNVGTAVDLFLRPYTSYEENVHLDLSFITYPNGEIRPRWYNGTIKNG